MKRTKIIEMVKINPELIAFEEDISLAGGKHSRLHHAIPFDDLVLKMQGPGVHAYHELILFDKPCRLFVDCDAGHLISEREHYVYLDMLCLYVSSHFKRIFSRPLARPQAICASRHGKTSLHVIWDEWFATPLDVKTFLSDLFSFNLFGVNIDGNVYPTTSSFTLRMPYCSKLSPRCPLIPLCPVRPEFDPDMFCRLLITPHQSSRFNIPSPPPELLSMETHRAVKRLRIAAENANPAIPLLLEWLELTMPCQQPSNPVVTATEDGSFSIRASVFCTIAGRFHKGNKAFIRVDRFGGITVICLDDECRQKKVIVNIGFTIRDVLRLAH